METPECNRIGYSWLAEKFEVATLPYWRESRALAKGARRLVEKNGRQIEYLPAARDPGDDVFAHLEFALKRRRGQSRLTSIGNSFRRPGDVPLGKMFPRRSLSSAAVALFVSRCVSLSELR